MPLFRGIYAGYIPERNLEGIKSFFAQSKMFYTLKGNIENLILLKESVLLKENYGAVFFSP